MSVAIQEQSSVPPGFRFHPTDEELVGYYLQKKVAGRDIDLDVIKEIDLYKMEPWDLLERCKIGTGDQQEWYFFSHKDKKYPTGTRTNRATFAGFWKATGRDKAVFANCNVIGMRKTLVFYTGRAPTGLKTDWIMHEYRLQDENNNFTANKDEGWVVCRVFKKRQIHRRASEADLESCYGSYEYPHSQLPQLESPKSSWSSPCSSGMGMILESTINRAVSYSLPIFMEAPNSESTHYKSVLPGHEQFHFQDEHVTEWRIVDKLVAEQLNDDQELKEMTCPTSSNIDSLEDHASLILQRNRLQQLDYPSTSSDDRLWNFGK
ncbi:hypothetical protein O6H91_22G007800 [Diphasiastrum complanatum]|uniref:Uncharacterized protein n=1 Tax=Diphasiastrum complanatum TaxID=34168 RepID=A0ACC2ACF9_DIPCM|nr:hypothetical protein O6H91_22G007800 [Diphasiastrum complanatum]